MENLALKIKISVLWLFFTVAMSAFWALAPLEAGAIEEVMAGELEGMQITAGLLFLYSLFWLIPLIMAFLSLILGDAANRWANFILGIIFAVFMIVDVTISKVRGEEHVWAIGLTVSMIVVPALIAWYAWRWPKQEA